MVHTAAKPAPVLSMDLWQGSETDIIALGDNAGDVAVMQTDHDVAWDAPARCRVESWQPHDGRCVLLACPSYLLRSRSRAYAVYSVPRLS